MRTGARAARSRPKGFGRNGHAWATVGSWIAGLGFTAMFAAGTFDAVALMPNWYGSNADGILLMRELLARGPTGMRTFFVPVALVTLAGLALASACGRSVRPRGGRKAAEDFGGAARLRRICTMIESLVPDPFTTCG